MSPQRLNLNEPRKPHSIEFPRLPMLQGGNHEVPVRPRGDLCHARCSPTRLSRTIDAGFPDIQHLYCRISGDTVR